MTAAIRKRRAVLISDSKRPLNMTASPSTRAKFVADVIAALNSTAGASSAPPSPRSAARAAHAALLYDLPLLPAGGAAALAAAVTADIKAGRVEHYATPTLVNNIVTGAAAGAADQAEWEGLAVAYTRVLERALTGDRDAADRLLAGLVVGDGAAVAADDDAPTAAAADATTATAASTDSDSDWDTPLDPQMMGAAAVPPPAAPTPSPPPPLDWPAACRAMAALATAAGAVARVGGPTWAKAGGNAVLATALGAAARHSDADSVAPAARALLFAVRDRCVASPTCAGDLLPAAWAALGATDAGADARLRVAADLTAAVAAAWPPEAAAQPRATLWRAAVASGLIDSLCAALAAAPADADSVAAALAELTRCAAAAAGAPAAAARALLPSGAWRAVACALAGGNPSEGVVDAALAGCAASGELSSYLAGAGLNADALRASAGDLPAALLAALCGDGARLAALLAPDTPRNAATALAAMEAVARGAPRGRIDWGTDVDAAVAALETELRTGDRAAPLVKDGDAVTGDDAPRDTDAAWRKTALRAATAARRAAGGGAKHD